MKKSDSTVEPVLPAGKRPNFSREFRREIVEKTMQPGASASRIALEHGLNANLFSSGTANTVLHNGFRSRLCLTPSNP